jgi:glyoxylase-like metal-dependent hydrolase (beta-lactamase superfamily II)
MPTLHGVPERFESGVREIAPGVHAWMQPNGSWGETNAALVAGEGASLLVDTLWTPALTRAMLAALAPVTEAAPIRHVVNTHADGDHCWGNQVLSGDVEIVATEAAAEEMTELSPKTLGAFRALARALSAGGRLRLPGSAAGSYVIGMFAPFDFSEVELTLPRRTFSGELTLDVGGRAVELIDVGPAHTAGDAIVWVPDAQAAIAADILFTGTTPVMWAGPTERWLAALERILALEPEVVLPGHGPVSGVDEVRVLRDYWQMVDASAKVRFGEGRSAYDAAVGITESEEFRAGPWAGWDHPERIVIGIHTIYRHLEGAKPGVSPVTRIRIFDEVGRLARRLRPA